MASPDRQPPERESSSALSPLQVAVGLGVAAGAWVLVELLRRLV